MDTTLLRKLIDRARTARARLDANPGDTGAHLLQREVSDQLAALVTLYPDRRDLALYAELWRRVCNPAASGMSGDALRRGKEMLPQLERVLLAGTKQGAAVAGQAGSAPAC